MAEDDVRLASLLQQSLAQFACAAEQDLMNAARPAVVAVATFTGNHELYRRAMATCPERASAASGRLSP